jgi:adenosine deaminase
LFTRKYVTEISKHPIRTLYDSKLFVTVNSDDPTLFSTSLVDEYMLLYDNGIFTREEIFLLMLNNINAAFLPQNKKAELERCIKDVFREAFKEAL